MLASLEHDFLLFSDVVIVTSCQRVYYLIMKENKMFYHVHIFTQPSRLPSMSVCWSEWLEDPKDPGSAC